MAKEISRSRALAAKVIFAALQILSKKGGQAPGRDVTSEIEKQVTFDDWAKTAYEKTGYIRWHSMLHFYSIDCIKAGFLVKNKGVWYITLNDSFIRLTTVQSMLRMRIPETDSA